MERLGKLFDANPNVYVDIAAVLAELGRQPYSARRFFLKYQDRIFRMVQRLVSGSDVVDDLATMAAPGLPIRDGDLAVIDVGLKSEGRVPLREFANLRVERCGLGRRWRRVLRGVLAGCAYPAKLCESGLAFKSGGDAYQSRCRTFPAVR